jgi:hypothetical protein
MLVGIDIAQLVCLDGASHRFDDRCGVLVLGSDDVAKVGASV